jgi:hypothetical protein
MRSLPTRLKILIFQLRTKVYDLKANTSINCQVPVILGLRPVTIPKNKRYFAKAHYTFQDILNEEMAE